MVINLMSSIMKGTSDQTPSNLRAISYLHPVPTNGYRFSNREGDLRFVGWVRVHICC